MTDWGLEKDFLHSSRKNMWNNDCIVLKKILGYELCILEKEGALFYSDPIVIIRKEGFTEIYNLQKHANETGDVISKQIQT